MQKLNHIYIKKIQNGVLALLTLVCLLTAGSCNEKQQVRENLSAAPMAIPVSSSMVAAIRPHSNADTSAKAVSGTRRKCCKGAPSRFKSLSTPSAKTDANLSPASQP